MSRKQAATPGNKCYLVINAGSSSYKFTLFAHDAVGDLARTFYGEIEGIGGAPRFYANNNQGDRVDERQWEPGVARVYLLGYLIDWIENHIAPNVLVAIGHRMVHGGAQYCEPLLITSRKMKQLRKLVHLSPLHQPRVLNAIDALTERHPELPHVVVFDTAFHATNPRISRLYGLPSWLSDEGIVRYGFHGSSYEYISSQLAHLDPVAYAGSAVVAHLGSGASMCALKGGKSMASTMGFTALDGLVMGTRCGVIDPGAVLYLLKEKKMTPQQVEDILYEKSGLLGVSGGISNDLRTLLASEDPKAKEAIELFVYRVVRETGSLAAAAGGMDAFVFTAGIGERSADVRRGVCEQLSWMGIKIDEAANLENRQLISTPDSKVKVWVIPTNEELMIARHVAALVG
ncbi:MAG: acetate/propionate family kinase [Oxalobacter sp.]|nr:MAG: acetate/propionate family kinase [Oxalobacter sp.]